MSNPQLVDYLKQAFAHGTPDDQIRATLKSQGWSDFDVGLAWQTAKTPAASGTETTKKKKQGGINASELLLFIGALIILVAAATLISAGWTSLNFVGRILAVLIPNAILLGAGFMLKKNPSLQHAGHAFMVTGALLFPVTLGISIWEIFPDAPEAGNLFATATIALLAYGLALLRYRDLIWMVLIVLTMIVAYSALLFWVEIDRWFDNDPFAWAYSLLGLGLIGLGMWIERSGWKFYARSPYFFGSLIFIIAFGVLGLSGTLFGEGWLRNGYDFGVPQMLTTGLVGLIFAAIGWLIGSRLAARWPELARMKPGWDLLGVLGIIGSFLLTEDEPVFHFIAIALSLGFFYLAVRLQVRQYFQASAFMLAVSLLRTGATYFADTLGWPVVLMVAGLLFMGGGFYLSRLQRSLFKPKTPSVPKTTG